MSRVEEKTNYKCPICSEPLILDIAGELCIVDHDYGFTNESPGADGCYCKNGHRIYIETESPEDDEDEYEDPQDKFDREYDED